MVCYPGDTRQIEAHVHTIPPVQFEIPRKKIDIQYWTTFFVALALALVLTILGTAWHSFMFTLGGMALTMTAAISLGETRNRP